MKRLWLAALLVSCAHARLPAAAEAPCTTACGLRGPGSCDELQRAERRIVAALNKHADRRTKTTCGALKGWTIKVHERTLRDDLLCAALPGAWARPSGLCVLGYTHQSERVVELTGTDYTRNSFSHEVVHVVDIAVTGEPGHCRWKARGVKTALRVIGLDDSSEPESDCPDAPR